jgi:hypothetical protein
MNNNKFVKKLAFFSVSAVFLYGSCVVAHRNPKWAPVVLAASATLGAVVLTATHKDEA